MIRYLSTLAIAIAAAFVAPPSQAEKVVVYREGQLVKPQDVAAVLGTTRSIRLLDDEPAERVNAATTVATGSVAKASARPAPRDARTDSPSEASALSLPVRFEFASAEILPAARAQLDALAQGIRLLAPGSVVMVEGHTDATGGDAYNLELSRARARSVRDYLVQNHGIASARLRTVGHGEGRPIDGTDPYGAVNRRVQFRGA